MNISITVVRNCESGNNISPDIVFVPWVIYNGNGNLFYEKKPVTERFKTLSENIYRNRMYRNVFCGKTIIKCGLPGVVFQDAHFGISTERKMCDI